MEEAHRFAAEVADRVVSCFLLGISKQHFCLGVVLDRLVVAIVGIVGRHFSYSVNRPMLRIAEIEVFFFFGGVRNPPPALNQREVVAAPGCSSPINMRGSRPQLVSFSRCSNTELHESAAPAFPPLLYRLSILQDAMGIKTSTPPSFLGGLQSVVFKLLGAQDS